jgi:hypothetical protein
MAGVWGETGLRGAQVVEDNRVCPHCGQPMYRAARSMRMDPSAPGAPELIRRWFAGDFTLLGGIAIFGLCVLIVLVALVLAL